ncbi:MAG: PD-(D/E)XK nuclease family protein, partial [Ilumatobacter sp.]|nr:PD-(D/E)XK nuclease family protein [Ilumatobacter sp.]
RQVSRWVAELEAASLTDARRAVASFAAGLAEAPFPATATQHRVRALVNARARGEDPAAHPLVAGLPALRLGAAMVAARGSAALTEYDGDLSAMDFDPLGDRPASPTRLEAWVACPHAWFLQHVLGVEPVEQPDEQLQITPRDRGTLVHDALDLFHREVLAGHVPPPGPTGWGPEHEAALLAAFEKVAADLAHLGLVGRRAFWHSEHTRQRRELQDWMAHDSELLVERGATVVASELRFGVTTPEGQEVPAATIDLGDGTALRFRGSIDRVDRCADGRLVVTDHKTGSDSHYRDITEADPTAGGSRLQLVVYAAAARAVTDVGPDTPVLAEYSFLGRGGFKRIGVTMDAANQPAAQAAVAGIVHGIRSRLFVALPEKAQYQLSWVRCPWCDPDGLGTAERWQEFERKQADPRVAALLGLDTDAATDAPDGPAEAPQ